MVASLLLLLLLLFITGGLWNETPHYLKTSLLSLLQPSSILPEITCLDSE